ncbi:MAG: hypothetical protein ISS36_01675 [Candidatus Aenigmarchaeota archaeon]|nr:hypothetical protein [Candidatus Aenigmarchaeota archaeon]
MSTFEIFQSKLAELNRRYTSEPEVYASTADYLYGWEDTGERWRKGDIGGTVLKKQINQVSEIYVFVGSRIMVKRDVGVMFKTMKETDWDMFGSYCACDIYATLSKVESAIDSAEEACLEAMDEEPVTVEVAHG